MVGIPILFAAISRWVLNLRDGSGGGNHAELQFSSGDIFQYQHGIFTVRSERMQTHPYDIANRK